MKQTTIQVKFDADKYKALLKYAKKKEKSVEEELVNTMDTLYKKWVPADVREFIEDEEETVKKEKPQRKKQEDNSNTADQVSSSPGSQNNEV